MRLFRGRLGRRDYAIGYVSILAIILLTTLVPTSVFSTSPTLETIIVFLVFSWLWSTILRIGLTTRRLHDLDQSGWWSLFLFIPMVGSLIVIVLLFVSGSKGENKYGQQKVYWPQLFKIIVGVSANDTTPALVKHLERGREFKSNRVSQNITNRVWKNRKKLILSSFVLTIVIIPILLISKNFFIATKNYIDAVSFVGRNPELNIIPIPYELSEADIGETEEVTVFGALNIPFPSNVLEVIEKLNSVQIIGENANLKVIANDYNLYLPQYIYLSEPKKKEQVCTLISAKFERDMCSSGFDAFKATLYLEPADVNLWSSSKDKSAYSMVINRRYSQVQTQIIKEFQTISFQGFIFVPSEDQPNSLTAIIFDKKDNQYTIMGDGMELSLFEAMITQIRLTE